MRRFSYIALVLLSSCFAGCEEKIDMDEVYQIGIVPCQRQPQFFGTTGLNIKRSALSTSEKRTKGLVLVQFPENNTDTAGRKIWQHPTWSSFGFMGSITTDENGNVYTIPVPVINVLDNPPEKQNTIYKVESTNGEMKPFAELPVTQTPENTNPFGLLGIYYDCSGKQLYACTVFGSTKEKENGIIFAVDAETGKITDKLTGKDAVALCVCGITGEKRLYFGSARSSDIYSIKLTKAGKFSGDIKKEISLDMLGPRGDDKARRIRFDKNGDMMVYAVEFNYNLTAPTEKQETLYRFRYYDEEKKWTLIP